MLVIEILFLFLKSYLLFLIRVNKKDALQVNTSLIDAALAQADLITILESALNCPLIHYKWVSAECNVKTKMLNWPCLIVMLNLTI